MGIYTPALVKGGLAVGVASVVAIPVALKGTGLLFGSVGRSEITKWDEFVIEKLNDEKFQFTVTDNSFPTAFNDDEQVVTVTYSDASEKGLKTKNNGTAWTWECKIKFKRENNDATALEETEKNIFTKENTGFLQKLKTYGTSNKEIKERFIRKCAKERGEKTNKLLDKTKNLVTTVKDNSQGNNSIKSEKLFSLIKNETTKKLEIIDKQAFKDWFEEQLETSILEKIFSSCSTTDFSCQLTKGELSKLKIISEDDEIWEKDDGLDLTINTAPNPEDSEKVAEISWVKPASHDKYFPLGWEFSIKTVVGSGSRTITIKKPNDDAKTIQLSNSTTTKFWLKEKDKKYYLAKELTQTKKEEAVNMSCINGGTTTTCSPKEATSGITGLTKNENAELSITKKTDPTNQYTVSNSTNDGDYKIIYNGTKWTMSKI